MITKLLLAGALFLATAVLAAREPVGIRSQNPGNLHGVHWQAWGGATGTDRYHYLRFRTPLDGIRAMKRVLDAYWTRHGIDTVAGIVNRWVRKPHDRVQIRALREYLLLVSKRSGYGPNQFVPLFDPRAEARVAKAIIYAENSKQPYPESLFREAFGY